MGVSAAIKEGFPRREFFSVPRLEFFSAIILAVLIPALLSFEARGDELPADTALTLEDLVSQMQEHNPQLKQAGANYAAAKAAVGQITTLDSPELALIEDGMPGHPLNLAKAKEAGYEITQPFSFPGKKKLEREIAKADAEIAGTEKSSLYLELLAQLKVNFYQMLILEQQLAVNRDSIARLEQIKKVAKVRYANNASAFVDYLNAQVDQSSAENEQFSLQSELDNTRGNLNTLVGREPSAPLKIKGELPGQKMPQTSLNEITDLALAFSPEVKRSSLELKSAQKNVSLAKASYLPDFAVVASNNSDNPPWGISGNEYGLELDLILPSWFFTKEKAGLSQAKANLMASQAGDAANRLQVKLAATSAYNDLAQAVNQKEFIRTRQLEQARIAYRLALVNYSNGRMDFTELLFAQDNLRQAELALLESEYRGIEAYLELVSAVGREIE